MAVYADAPGMDAGDNSYFPHWKLRREGVIAPNECLPAGQTVALGIQHVVAMFGATVLAPLLMGFDPNVAILSVWHADLLRRGRRPRAELLGLELRVHRRRDRRVGLRRQGLNANLGVALGGIIAAGVVYALIGAGVMAVGYAWIERLAAPPPVTGAIVAVIGLNLAPIAVKGVSGSTFDTWIGLATIVAVGVIAGASGGASRAGCHPAGRPRRLRAVRGADERRGPGEADRLRRGPRPAAVLLAPRTSPRPSDGHAMLLIAPVAIVLVAENLGQRRRSPR